MTISSSKFFTAAASKQYDDLIQIYGNTAIEALQNYQNVQMRWISQEHSNNQRSSRGTVPLHNLVQYIAARRCPGTVHSHLADKNSGFVDLHHQLKQKKNLTNH